VAFANILLLVAGPAALAVWIDARFPRLRPFSLAAVAAVAMAGVIAVSVCGEPLAQVVDALVAPPLAQSIYVALALGLLTFGYLSCVWLLRAGVAYARAWRS
jgi:hypothetical protein